MDKREHVGIEAANMEVHCNPEAIVDDSKTRNTTNMSIPAKSVNSD